MLTKFADQLKPGGKVLMDVDSLVRFAHEPDIPLTYSYEAKGGFFAPEAYHLYLSQHRYETDALLLRRENVYTLEGSFELYHWSQCFSKTQLEAEFRAAGLKITEFYSDVAGAPCQDDSWVLALVAEKD